jgi:selenocysteine lyase/cysteine desulfurase
MSAGSLLLTGESVRAGWTGSCDGGGGTPRLPDKERFPFSGTHLNAAFVHPLGAQGDRAARDFFNSRLRDVDRLWPVDNARNAAVDAYARLINALPADIAVVPSTLVGENLIAASLELGPGRGVVTDPFHYDASLAMYGERQRRGMPLTVVSVRHNRIDYDDLRRSIRPETRLVAVSWVSSWTGFAHDLKAVCEIAHEKGAMVYADVIQGVGALALDVKETGIDFCCAGTYKWLMGDFGVAFLYVRADRLHELKRDELGWRGLTSFTPHFLPYDTPGPPGGNWTLGTGTPEMFEVGTPDWCALGVADASIKYIQSIGVSRIVAHRAPLLEFLQAELAKKGLQSLTPRDQQGPFVTFASESAHERFARRLEDAHIYVTLGKNRIRVSASVYNDMADVERLVRVIST